MSVALLIAAGVLVGTACVALAMLPILQRDMARTVARGTKPPVDMTALTLMFLGAFLVVGVPASAGLLWSTWA